jgi:GNAT superfamily N-acetyltransferase
VSERAVVRPALPADAARLAQIHVMSWRETYEGLMPTEFLTRMTDDSMRARREQNWAYTLQEGLDCSQVAEVGGVLMGFASGGAVRPHTVLPGDYGAELFSLYTLREAQGQGLGRLLVAALARELHGRGFQGLALWVLASNRARQFYAHLGARELGQKTEIIPGGELLEVAMGWRQLQSLF